MARIRSIKPNYFRHEGLQALEEQFPGLRPMLVFAGLWPVSDRLGQFEWRPRQLHLDILPFLPFDFEASLELLEKNGYVERYEAEGKTYGRIPSWRRHQRITGQEAKNPPRYPSPFGLQQDPVVSPGSSEETTEKQPKKARGRKPRGEKDPTGLKLPSDLEPWFDAIWFDVWPSTVVRDGQTVAVNPGRKGPARRRFKDQASKFLPVALYLSTRAYVRNDPKVKEGYVQTVETFFGPGKSTYEEYLEEILPWLDKHPSVKALTAPPESEEAFQSLCKKDKSV